MQSLNAQDWLRALALLDDALDMPQHQQATWLSGLTGESAQVRAAVAAMIQQRQQLQAAEFLGQDALRDIDDVGATQATDVQASLLGVPRQQLGPWRLLRLLGQGGMAQVWLAQREDGAHQRQVALKLPHGQTSGQASAPGSDGTVQARVIAERFLRERAILSTLRHAHIAQVLDAGSEGSQAWLAMEFVDGLPITAYAMEHQLSVPARLRLFLQVLQAVAYAHGRLVLHRDIKPANVLVDTQGQVKLLDFGVAKLLQSENEPAPPDTQSLTLLGGRAMTPQYASPEQIAGHHLTTASDVYSLGVLLYELLTGRLPYALKRGTAAELEQAILDSERLLPSRAVATQLGRRELRGDVDLITMMALQAEPSKRYASVQALAQDIERHLAHQPIAARPDAWGYRLQKLWRRQRLAMSAALAVTAAVLLGLGVALLQVRQTKAQFAQALARQQASQAVQLLVESTMNAAGEDGQQRGVVAGLAHIENVARQLYGNYPEVQAEVLLLLGAKYGSLQQPKERKRLMDDALVAARASGVAPLAGSAECRTVYAYADDAIARVRLAVSKLGAGAEFARARFDCYGFLATLLAFDGQAAAAEDAANRAQAELPLMGALAPLLMPEMQETKADVARASGRLEMADSLYAQSIATLQASGRARTLKTSVLLNYRMLMLLSIGRPQQALAVSDELQAFFEGMGSIAQMPAYMISNRSNALLALGQPAAAELAARLAVQRAINTGSVIYEVGARGRLVEALLAQGHITQAEEELGLRQKALQQGGKPDNDGRSELLQARLAFAKRNPALALQALAQAQTRFSASAFERPGLVQALLLKARVLSASGESAASVSAANQALQLCNSMGGAPSIDADQARALLAQVPQHTQPPALAAPSAPSDSARLQ